MGMGVSASEGDMAALTLASLSVAFVVVALIALIAPVVTASIPGRPGALTQRGCVGLSVVSVGGSVGGGSDGGRRRHC